MSSFVRSVRSHSLVSVAILAGALVCAAPAFAGSTSGQIDVVVDQAKLIKLPDRISTIVVGNPMIADVNLQPGGVMVVTGKGYGSTNVIAMDRDGRILIDRMIQVEGPSSGNLVTVYRGVDRETYSCTPICQRRITLGDSASYFSQASEQVGAFNGQATGQATAAAATAQPAAKPQ
jgi:Flp pilus assembly secretin CpaC